MTLIALASRDETFWWIALGIGAVVLVVVVALLTLLLRMVEDIRMSVDDVWQAAKLVAGNTVNGWQFRAAASHIDELRAEVQAHRELVERR